MIPTAVYPSDLTDAQWAAIFPLLDRTGQRGRPQAYDLRCVFNACVYVVNTGCPWRSLPQDAYPPWPGVYKHFQIWVKSAVFERVTLTLNREVRKLAKRNETPSTVIADAHSLKSRHGGEAIGFDGNKKVHGRKNQLMSDTLGLLWGVHTHAANLSDTKEVVPLLNDALQTIETVDRVYFDLGYQGTGVSHVEEELLLQAVIPDRGLGTKSVAFQPAPVRWRIERTVAWVTRFRRLANSFERTVTSCKGFAWLVGCLIALGKLVGGRPWQKKKVRPAAETAP